MVFILEALQKGSRKQDIDNAVQPHFLLCYYAVDRCGFYALDYAKSAIDAYFVL